MLFVILFSSIHTSGTQHDLSWINYSDLREERHYSGITDTHRSAGPHRDYKAGAFGFDKSPNFSSGLHIKATMSFILAYHLLHHEGSCAVSEEPV